MRINIRPAAAHTVMVVHNLSSFTPYGNLSQRTLVAARILELFAAARRIRRDLQSSANHKPLRNKNVALLLAGPVPSVPSTLQRAATELGARVSQVWCRQPDGALHVDITPMARTLGHMYDAIDCGTLPAATVREIEKAAGVPVYEGLGLDSHPARMLADLMTLYEHPRPASPSPNTIHFRGDPGSEHAKAFISAARNIGFEVIPEDNPPAANDAAFVVDACNSPRWPMHASSHAIDEQRRDENHRSVIQAVLVDTISRA